MWLPGWGDICVICKHVFADNEKYLPYPPTYPCKQVRPIPSPSLPPPLRIPDLHTEGEVETCPDFEDATGKKIRVIR